MYTSFLPSRRLRSSDDPWLQAIPAAIKGDVRDRSFGALAPRLWNFLPVLMRGLSDTLAFIKILKTFYQAI
jgi:hypothetical protein